MPKEDEPAPLNSFIRNIPQIVPESWCLECRICCRFPDTEGVQTPTWSKEEAGWIKKDAWLSEKPSSPSLHPRLQPCGNDCHCPAFSHESNRCTIYPDRPLDCRLYPFVMVRHPAGSVVLAMDLKCPYLQEHGSDPEVGFYAERLAKHLDSPEGSRYVLQNPDVAGANWPEFISVAALPSLSSSVVDTAPSSVHPSLKPVTKEEWPRVERLLKQANSRYSGYTLASLCGWGDLIRLWWAPVEQCVCLFSEQAGGFFMPLPPLGGPFKEQVAKAAWKILEELNGGSLVSRIEGWENLPAIQGSGFSWRAGEQEYLYSTEDLAGLRGDRYRSQRWAVNRCRREVSGVFRPFEQRDLTPCLQLYTRWAIQRQRAHEGEREVKALARDGLFFHRRLMMDREPLGLIGRVFETEGKVLGYTFGGPISSEVYGIFLEIADRAIPGLAQRLFQEFCKEIQAMGFRWINAMGDSGLPGLRQAKQAYHPAEILTTAIATRGN